ncbi:MAG: hypothetical protein H6825_12080 [Planctomycetes bacterium]|nr:hypothetical protein [Planctomycetota bacterium]
MTPPSWQSRGYIISSRDYINFSGRATCLRANIPKFGERFPDLTAAYDPERFHDDLRDREVRALSRGILAQFLGPTYETPAEVRMAKAMGARAVSMSMVPDVIVARQRRMRVAGLASVTNYAAGLADGALLHDDVLLNSARNATTMQTLLSGALPRLHATPSTPKAHGRGTKRTPTKGPT